jgi:hypothetical protein
MELEVIMLSKISQAQKANTPCFCLFVNFRLKMMMIIIIESECKRGTVSGVGRRKGNDTEG